MASTSKTESEVDAGPPAPATQSPGIATSAVASAARPGTEGTDQRPNYLSGMFNPDWQKEGMPDTAFNRKYPPDAWGEEFSPNARVWKIYRDQQETSHSGMLDGWNKTLDVLLIFAGLFSTILTAFLIESYQALQPDFSRYVATFLYAAAEQHSRTGGIFPALDKIVAPDGFVQISAAQRLTNGLWFSSLVISLVVALLCILIKQWLDAYDSHVSSAAPSSIHWARRHSLYHRGLITWGVPGLISFLPLLLHLSLLLFFLGLILFLRPLDSAISYSLLGMVSCIAAFYVLSLVLPAWRVECPSYTPLLAHALLAVSRAISGFQYIVTPAERRAADTSTNWDSDPEDEPPGVLSAFSALAQRLGRWLQSMEPRAWQQLAREAVAISQGDRELDGYVLSALITLPTDANRDIVHAACAVLGGITSSRTLEVIFSQVPHDVFADKIDDWERHIPSPRTGFEVTSHAQLCRAEQIMWPHSHRPPRAPRRLHLESIGDWLMQSLARPNYNIRPVIRQLQSLRRDRSHSFPHRSACLVYLELYSGCSSGDASGLSEFLLFFCAGRFEGADTEQLVRALRSVESVLSKQCSITLRDHNGGELDYLCAVVNGLWTMLARFKDYQIDALTAQIVAEHALAYVEKIHSSKSGFVWSRLSGLSTLARSPTFAQCVADDSIIRYFSLFDLWKMRDRTTVPLSDYWDSMAALWKLCWARSPLVDIISILEGESLFSLPPLWDPWVFLSEGGPYATQDDWYEPVLSAFLDGPNAISTWTFPIRSHDDFFWTSYIASLAYRVAIVLCRRQRFNRPNEAFIPGFFAGTFLLERFRDLISNEQEDKPDFDAFVLSLAKHCMKISPADFLNVCTELEGFGDEGSKLRARAVAFVDKIRDGSVRGDALSAECDGDCTCMQLGLRLPPSTRTRWSALAARFWRGRTQTATSSNV